MKRVIYRVDDRFIHGQVIEGWINYFHIPNIILVNDRIAGDPCQRFIYESIMPQGSNLIISSLYDFERLKLYDKFKKGSVLIIFGSIGEFYSVHKYAEPDAYINIGCLATGDHCIEITDTVFLDLPELRMLADMALTHDIFVHKLPSDSPVDIRDFIRRFSEGDQ